MTEPIIAAIHSRPGWPNRSMTEGGNASGGGRRPEARRARRGRGRRSDRRSGRRRPRASPGRGDLPRVRADPVAHLPGQVRVLDHLPDPDALRGVVPAIRREVRRQGLLARVPERGVPDVVAERDGLRQRLVQAQCRRQRACHLGDLHRVRQARHEVVALGVQEDLGLVLEPPERLGVMIRSRSRSKAVRNSSGSSGRSRPRLAVDLVAAGLSPSSSASRATRSRRRSSVAALTSCMDR